MLSEEDKKWLCDVMDQKYGIFRGELSQQNNALREELNQKHDALREELSQQNNVLREELNQKHDALREELSQQNNALREELSQKHDSLREELNQQNNALREELLQRIEDEGKKLRKDLNHVIDARSVVFLEEMDRKMDEKAAEISRHLDIQLENNVYPVIDECRAILPGATKSYKLLEERVSHLESDFSVLKVVLAERL